MIRKLATGAIAGVTALAALTGAANANGIFLKSDIRTDSREPQGFEGQVRLSSLNWALLNDGRLGGGGVCRVSDMTITKDIDGATVQLIEAASLGKSIGNPAVITLTRDLGYDRNDPAREFAVLELSIDRASIVSYTTAVSDQSLAMAETIELTSATNIISARAFEYNPNNGRLVRTREIPVVCGSGGI